MIRRTDKPIMPLFYHGRLKGNSDKHWIMGRMSFIPEDKQQEIAEEYSRIYQSEKVMARKKANTWLDGVAREYREAARNGS